MKSLLIAFALLVGALIASCRRPAELASAPIPLPGAWDHCWWTVMRSRLPVDSVGSEFRRAFITMGLPGIHWTRTGDTIFVRAGPAPLLAAELDSTTYGATYWSRAVAFSQGDSTHFRLYVAIVPPVRGWAHAADSARANRPIAVCAAIAKTVGFRWIRRAGDPGDEEKLPVWSHIP